MSDWDEVVEPQVNLGIDRDEWDKSVKNIDEKPKGEFQPVPPGTYQVTIKSKVVPPEDGRSSKIELELYFPGNKFPITSREWDSLWLSGASVFRAQMFLAQISKLTGIGWDQDLGKDGKWDGDPANIQALVAAANGATATVEIFETVSKKDGKTYINKKYKEIELSEVPF